MLGNFSKVLMAHISFTAVLNNGGIGKNIGGIRKSTKRNLYLRNLQKNNRVVKPKCYQVILRYLKIKQFSKRFDRNNIFTAILTNGGIGKGISDTGKGIKKNNIYNMWPLTRKRSLRFAVLKRIAVRKPFISRSNGMGCRSNGLSYPFKNN